MKLAMCAFAAAFLIAAPALAEDLTFKLNNQSSSPVDGFYVSHVGTSSWEENLIEGHVLPSGNSVDVIIADGRSTCEYDIKATFEDGSETDDRNINLCDLGSYTVHDAQ